MNEFASSGIPSFAVVGHPNKGKSSIVATLARDDSVAIGREPGTTRHHRQYPMTVDGALLYTLIDTPGFQRARAMLARLKEQERSAADRPQIVRSFLEDPANSKHFPDECELLAPIVQGAGILYVVDGSVPYSEEYEPELEILRWTGQPRMALVNPISDTAFVEDWRAALGQYFSVVRVFNAVTAEFDKQIDLLRTFGRLQEDWHEPLERAVSVLLKERSDRIRRISHITAEMLVEMITLIIEEKAPGPGADLAREKEALLERYRARLRDIEQRARTSIEYVLHHEHVRKREAVLEELRSDELFSAKTWRLFGLSKREVVTYSTVAGAAIGSVVDAATGGASLLLGGLLGGVAGASTALFAADSLVDVKILFKPLGRRVLSAGPVKSIQFPHVVLGRARLHHKLLAQRTHARRDVLDLTQPVEEVIRPLPGRTKGRFEKIFNRLRKGSVRAEDVEQLAEELETVLAEDMAY